MRNLYRSLVFWLLFPLLIPQALHVRRNALRLPPAAGPVQGSQGRGPDRHLLAIGDSIIAGVGAADQTNALVGQTARVLAERLNVTVNWSAHGLNGATVAGVLSKLVSGLPAQPAHFIIVSVGINDVTSLSRLGQWRDGLSTLLTTLTRHSPGAIVAVAGMPPLHLFPALPLPLKALLGFRAKTLAGEMQRITATFPRAVYVPLNLDLQPGTFAKDGYHPSQSSYVVFGQGMAEHILSRLDPESVLT